MARTAKRRPQRLSKAAAQFRHAQRNAAERYSVHFNKEGYDALCRQIQDGKGEYLGKQSNRVTVWRIDAMATTTEGQVPVKAVVIYDKLRHRIVTFLPKGITDAKGVDLSELDQEGDEEEQQVDSL